MDEFSIDGTLIVPALAPSTAATVVDDQIVAFGGVTFSFGNSLELTPINLADAGLDTPHITANEVNSFYGFGGFLDYTAMAWARIDSNEGDNFIFGNSDINNTNALHLGSRGASYHSGHWSDDLTESPLETGAWHHVTFTNNTDGAQAIYVDGVLASTPQTDTSSSRGGRPTAAYELLIGTSSFGGTGSFIGGLDQVRVFNGLLTPEEILAEVTSGLIPLSSPTFLSSTIVENETLVITINDFVGDTTATVDPTNLILLVDGVTVPITSTANASGVTTVNYDIPAADLPLALETLTFEVQGSTVEGQAFDFSGTQTVAALPNDFPGAIPTTPDAWIVDEYREEAITAAGIALPSTFTGADAQADAHRAMVDLIALGATPTTSFTAPRHRFHRPRRTRRRRNFQP